MISCADAFPAKRRKVIVPGRVAAQPAEAARAIVKHADEIVELGLPLSDPKSYWARNGMLVSEEESDAMVAFLHPDPRKGSGSRGTREMWVERRGILRLRTVVLGPRG